MSTGRHHVISWGDSECSGKTEWVNTPVHITKTPELGLQVQLPEEGGRGRTNTVGQHNAGCCPLCRATSCRRPSSIYHKEAVKEDQQSKFLCKIYLKKKKLKKPLCMDFEMLCTKINSQFHFPCFSFKMLWHCLLIPTGAPLLWLGYFYQVTVTKH